MSDDELLQVTHEDAGNRLAVAMASAIKRLETIQETNPEICVDDDLQNCREALALFRRIPTLSDREAAFNTRPTKGHDALVEAWGKRTGTIEVTSGSELPHLKIVFDDKNAMRAFNDILTNLPTPQPEAAPDYGLVAELDAFFTFLAGSSPLDGCWFGESHKGYKGSFWWRLKAANLRDRILTALRARNGEEWQTGKPPAPDDGLIADLHTEADLCRNEGAEDIARLLDRAIAAITALRVRPSGDGLVAELENLAARTRGTWSFDQANELCALFPRILTALRSRNGDA